MADFSKCKSNVNILTCWSPRRDDEWSVFVGKEWIYPHLRTVKSSSQLHGLLQGYGRDDEITKTRRVISRSARRLWTRTRRLSSSTSSLLLLHLYGHGLQKYTWTRIWNPNSRSLLGQHISLVDSNRDERKGRLICKCVCSLRSSPL